jgi:hypothetical protein
MYVRALTFENAFLPFNSTNNSRATAAGRTSEGREGETRGQQHGASDISSPARVSRARHPSQDASNPGTHFQKGLSKVTV